MNNWKRLGSCLLLTVAVCMSDHPGPGPLNEFGFLEGTWAQTTARETIEEV